MPWRAPSRAIWWWAAGVVSGRRPAGLPAIDADGVHRAQDAPHHLREALLGQLALRERRAQRLGEGLGVPHHHVDLRARLLVEPRQRVVPGGRGPPIGHDPARVAPRALEDLLEEDPVGARVVAVDLVVGGHDRAGLAAFDGDLEREQVGFAMGGRIDERVEPVAVGLVAVQREVLDRRDHALALDPGDRLAGEHAAEQRVLGQVLEVAPVARVAREVDAAGQHHVEAAAARLAADHRARGARQGRVEARAQGDARRQGGRGVARPVARVGDAEARVAHEQRRHPEALDARDVARAHGDVRGDALVVVGEERTGAHDAHEEREALLVGHLRLGLAGSFVGGHGPALTRAGAR